MIPTSALIKQDTIWQERPRGKKVQTHFGAKAKPQGIRVAAAIGRNEINF